MDLFSSALSNLGSSLSLAWAIFIGGGWVLFVLVLLMVAFKLYMLKINIEYAMSNKVVCLHVRIQKENLQSTLAVEQIFSQLHAIHSNFTWAQKYLEGQFLLSVSLEMVSIGGKISFIIRSYEKYLNLIESAIYAHYPSAEIVQVADYMEHLSSWDPDKSTWDFWGTEYTLTNDYAFPLKTYPKFEHPTAEDKIIDPLGGLFEALGKIEPHELMAIQYTIRPKADGEWQPHVKEMVAMLKGEKTGEKKGFFSGLFEVRSLLDFFRGPGGAKEEKASTPGVMRLSEGEKRTLLSVEEKMSKPGWDVKMRTIYIAPKDKQDSTKRTAMIGAFRPLSGMTTNNLKPDSSRTWTDFKYKMFKESEKPYVNYQIERKKRKFLKAYTERSMYLGINPMVLNTEELATLYHFPISTTLGAPPVESIAVKKGQPPPDLPIIP